MYYSRQHPNIYITQGCSEVMLRLRIKLGELLDPSEIFNKFRHKTTATRRHTVLVLYNLLSI